MVVADLIDNGNPFWKRNKHKIVFYNDIGVLEK